MCISAVLSLHKCTISSFIFSSRPLFIPKWFLTRLYFLFTTFTQIFPLQLQESALQDVRRCLSAVCQRTLLSSSSWRSSDSVVTSPPYAKARKTSAILDLLRSSLWTRLFSCQVICHYSNTIFVWVVISIIFQCICVTRSKNIYGIWTAGSKTHNPLSQMTCLNGHETQKEKGCQKISCLIKYSKSSFCWPYQITELK